MSDRQSAHGTERATLPTWAGRVLLVVFLFFFLGLVIGVFLGFFVLLMAVLFFVVGLGCIYLGTTFYRKHALIRNTSTERVRSIALGRTELEGVCQTAGQVFSQPFAAGKCLYADWEIEEYTRSGDDRDWSTVARGVLSGPFYLEDSTGTVLVDDPADATVRISDENTRETTVDRNRTPGPEIGQFCTEQDVSPTATNRRRYTQRVLTEGTDVYVLGFARRLEDPDEYDSANDVVITRDGDSQFIVSDRQERDLAREYLKGAIVLVLYGIGSSAVALYAILVEFQGTSPL